MSPMQCSNSNAGNCKDAGTARRDIEEERVLEVDWSEGGRGVCRSSASLGVVPALSDFYF